MKLGTPSAGFQTSSFALFVRVTIVCGFLQLFCTNGISPMGNSGKASCDRVALPNLRCMLGVLVFP